MHSLRISVCALALLMACRPSFAQPRRVAVANPYENVDWQTFSRYRGDTHVHRCRATAAIR